MAILPGWVYFFVVVACLSAYVFNPVVKGPVVTDGPDGIFESLVKICVCMEFSSDRSRHCLTLE